MTGWNQSIQPNPLIPSLSLPHQQSNQPNKNSIEPTQTPTQSLNQPFIRTCAQKQKNNNHDDWLTDWLTTTANYLSTQRVLLVLQLIVWLGGKKERETNHHLEFQSIHQHTNQPQRWNQQTKPTLIHNPFLKITTSIQFTTQFNLPTSVASFVPKGCSQKKRSKNIIKRVSSSHSHLEIQSSPKVQPNLPNKEPPIRKKY